MLQKKGLTLPVCVDMCRAYEATEKRLKAMGGDEEKVHQLTKQQGTRTQPNRGYTQQEDKKVRDKTKVDCGYCGLKHPKGRSNCSANGKEYMRCGKLNHYARKCKTKANTKQRVHHTQESSEEEELLTLTLTNQEDVNSVAGTDFQKQIFATMMVQGTKPVKFQIDTGATCNVIRSADVPHSEPTDQMLTMYNHSKIRPRGRCEISLKNPRNNKKYTEKFIVVDDAAVSVLGARAVQQMALGKVQYEHIRMINPDTDNGDQEMHRPLTLEEVCKRYAEAFDAEIGRLGDQLRRSHQCNCQSGE